MLCWKFFTFGNIYVQRPLFSTSKFLCFNDLTFLVIQKQEISSSSIAVRRPSVNPDTCQSRRITYVSTNMHSTRALQPVHQNGMQPSLKFHIPPVPFLLHVSATTRFEDMWSVQWINLAMCTCCTKRRMPVPLQDIIRRESLRDHSLGHRPLWPLTFQLRQQYAERQCWDSSSPQYVGHRDLCVALFSSSSCVVEKQWCHSAVQPCCRSLKASPFDFDWNALSSVLWRWPRSVCGFPARTGRWHQSFSGYWCTMKSIILKYSLHFCFFLHGHTWLVGDS